MSIAVLQDFSTGLKALSAAFDDDDVAALEDAVGQLQVLLARLKPIANSLRSANAVEVAAEIASSLESLRIRANVQNDFARRRLAMLADNGRSVGDLTYHR